jgi:hypothetical protein
MPRPIASLAFSGLLSSPWALASAEAIAPIELLELCKALTATIRSPFSQGADRTFRYASLASGLDIVRKSLGQQEIATIQTTAIDQESGQIRLTTLLAHASGEWISSIWPVCSVSETAAPHRMGAALTYARRYALFALVGIAGENDLDAPDILNDRPHSLHGKPPEQPRKAGKNIVHRPPVLDQAPSEELRDRLITEVAALNDGEELAQWAYRRLPAKNTLTEADSRLVEAAYHAILVNSREDSLHKPERAGFLTSGAIQPQHVTNNRSTPSTARLKNRTIKPSPQSRNRSDDATRRIWLLSPSSFA